MAHSNLNQIKPGLRLTQKLGLASNLKTLLVSNRPTNTKLHHQIIINYQMMHIITLATENEAGIVFSTSV